jgi:tRNA(Ile)-lysidine synthetase-like protein
LPESTLRHFFDTYQLPADIAIAFSGGRDSTVLAFAAARVLSADLVTLIHVDHQLRSDSSREVEFCRNWAAEQNISFVNLAVSISGSGSLEELARSERYRVLEEWALTQKRVILTAHHREDQAETILFRLLRGTGINGLAGIYPHHDLFYRPFLSLGMHALRAYAERHKLSYYSDPSNRDTSFSRNYLRHEIMPLLRQRFGAHVDRQVVHLQQSLANYFSKRESILSVLRERALIRFSYRQFSINKQVFDLYHDDMIKFWIEHSCRQVLARPWSLDRSAWQQVLHLLHLNNGKWQGKHGIQLRSSATTIFWQLPVSPLRLELPLASQRMGEAAYMDWRITWRWGYRHEITLDAMHIALCAAPDAAIALAPAPPGATVQLTGNNFTSKLRKVYQAAGIPAAERNRQVVLIADDEILGGPWLGAGEKARLRSDTERGILFSFKRDEVAWKRL